MAQDTLPQNEARSPGAAMTPLADSIDKASVLNLLKAYFSLNEASQDELARGICLDVLQRYQTRVTIYGVGGETAGVLMPMGTLTSEQASKMANTYSNNGAIDTSRLKSQSAVVAELLKQFSE
jgi:hypothetical protein